MATFTDILNVVAPPISEHEVIQIWLSHDMEGYDGVENLVYRAMARVRAAHASDSHMHATLIDTCILAFTDHGTSRGW